jgi:asparagine N-glycosylation enzyme membrane subunit Stt3
MQYLTGIGANREDWVIAELLGVAIGGSLLVIPSYLTDRRVDVDHHGIISWGQAHCPGTGELISNHLV